MTTLNALVEKTAASGFRTVAVASAADPEVLQAVEMAMMRGIASFILVDNEELLKRLIKSRFPELESNPYISIEHADTIQEAAEKAVRFVSTGEAQVLMKGNLPTAIVLKAVLNSEYGLRTGKVLSHVAAFEVDGYNRLLFVTDAGMNIAPNLEEKAQIIRNSVAVAKACGVAVPIVAPLAAIETINPVMIPTTDAAALVVMNQRGQIKDCIVDGPLALDNAVSVKSAQHKGIVSDTAGKADILVVPSIEAGNILYKSLMYFANAKVGGIIQGARAPIVLTSRSDSAETKLYSLALAIQTSKK
ncbi:phosphate butyryltransferase [Sporosarcina thermotolerans]|uniref:Phosphate butyryltransferase n=1 Tax=Sporosarcina thermotolerans TaxID=633404 RepID=A0AAW9A8D0_9BACL|nr:phosphate butyryltransferase [Sporosarcina thermotolerans]MDW0117299.1 phosphate butyryltransferase [Sporosarcina thermotolerans]WHT47453.1 phosphate butyryltransferase [Sporosarcina thermotolerans]